MRLDPADSSGARRDPRTAPARPPYLLASLAAYLLVFASLAWPWLRVADHAVPSGGMLAPHQDQMLVIWILAWVAHALGTTPGRLFDAPINFPARAQLAGSEHLLSGQLVAGPVWMLTGNATLAANVLVLVSYPLGALAFQRLAVAFGVRHSAAWVAGLLFALGPLAVPGHPQLAQYLAGWLPLTALTIHRLAAISDARRTVAFGLAFTGAIFSSYYMAVLASTTVAVCTLVELAGRPPARRAFLVRLTVAGLVAIAMLVAVSQPYLARGEAVRAAGVASSLGLARATPFIDGTVARDLALSALVAVPGLLALRASRAAQAGLALVLVALPFLAGWRPFGHDLAWSPFAALMHSPLSFFRLWYRFAVLVGFGLALLAAAGLELAARRRWTAAVVPLVAVAVVAQRGMALSGAGRTVVRGQVDAVHGAIAALPPGPVLELTTTPDDDVDAMIGQTRHWRPLVRGYTGYPPPLRQWIDARANALPDPDALDDLVAVTGLAALLVHDGSSWHRLAPRSGSFAGTGLTPLLSGDGWHVLRVDRSVERSYWREAAARPPGPDTTPLGTPLAPPDPTTVLGTLRVVPSSARFIAGAPLHVRVEVTNLGRAPWPADPSAAPVMFLESAWLSPGHPESAAGMPVPLRRDVAAGERVGQWLPVTAPPTPGTWVLRTRLLGPGFAPYLKVTLSQTPIVVVPAPGG